MVWRLLTPAEQRCSSARREVLAMVLGIRAFGSRLKRSRVVLRADALAAVGAYNKGRMGGDGHADVELAHALAEGHHLYTVATFLPREFNPVPDAASKCASRKELQSWAAAQGLRVAAVGT